MLPDFATLPVKVLFVDVSDLLHFPRFLFDPDVLFGAFAFCGNNGGRTPSRPAAGSLMDLSTFFSRFSLLSEVFDGGPLGGPFSVRGSSLKLSF
jgi:hypothetical protein